MSLSTDCRVASLEAFLQARAMGTGTNAGGGVLAGASDCGRDEGGKFGSGNTCASGTNSHGTWDIKKEPKEPSSPNRLATTHVVRLTGKDGKVKAYIDVEMGHDNETLYVDYGHVAEPYRGKGVYKDLLDSLSDQYTVVSDEIHNVATPVRKAYEALGAKVNQYGSYELKKKSKRDSRAFCPTGEGGGVDNSCGSVASPADKTTGGGSMPKSKAEDPRNANSWLSPSGEFHPVARESSDGGWNTHHRWAVAHGVTGGEEELLAKGWMRVVRVGQSLYAANEDGKALTDKQAKSLSEHAAWAGYDDVVHEHAKGRSKTVWSKDDRSLALEARTASLLAFAEARAFCPTGEGGGVDNSCGISNSDGERIRGVRGKSDKIQTKVARKIYQMRTSEKQIKKLIRDLGGKVGNSLVEIDTTRGDEGINIFVRDREHNETHYIHMGYYGATIYTTDKATEGEMDSIKDAAKEAFPKTIDKRLYRGGDEYPIEVVGDPTKTANTWGGLSAKQRLKAKLDARYASLLAFAESRDCGRDPDGKFSSGNTCAGGAIAEAAKGAAAGAVKGAITGLLAGGPATVKPGAAIGAGVGAVKGIYDNQMRPTRVKRAIEGLGMTTEQVGSLVEKLGGTPDSSADTKGSVLRLTIRDKDGKKSFHVEVDKKTITVYPRRASGELTGREIVRLKKIADESTPKSISVVVKKSSSAYVAKLVKNGFTMAAGHAADVLVANYSTPLVHSVASDVYQSLKKKFS